MNRDHYAAIASAEAGEAVAAAADGGRRGGCEARTAFCTSSTSAQRRISAGVRGTIPFQIMRARAKVRMLRKKHVARRNWVRGTAATGSTPGLIALWPRNEPGHESRTDRD